MLQGCTGWSAPLLFASNKVKVSCVEAHLILKARLPGPGGGGTLIFSYIHSLFTILTI